MSTIVEQYRSVFKTTANQLTVLRIVLVPVFISFLISDEKGWALVIFLLAGITDALDGLIARRFGQKTSIGGVLDPIADKLLMTASFLILTLPQMEFPNTIPRWLTVTVIFRDVFLMLTSLIIVLMSGFRMFKPSIYGKMSTIFQISTVLIVLFFNWRTLAIRELQYLYWTTGALTALSGLHYFWTGRKYWVFHGK